MEGALLVVSLLIECVWGHGAGHGDNMLTNGSW